jgi:hypothetical protein
MHAYFRTDRFRQELTDDEVDAVVLGEDCLQWLSSLLKSQPGIATERPIFEDWGWTMALSVNGSQLWVNVQDWSFEQSQTWHLWVEPRGIVARIRTGRHKDASARLRQAIDHALSADPAIREVRWSEAKPM